MRNLHFCLDQFLGRRQYAFFGTFSWPHFRKAYKCSSIGLTIDPARGQTKSP